MASATSGRHDPRPGRPTTSATAADAPAAYATEDGGNRVRHSSVPHGHSPREHLKGARRAAGQPRPTQRRRRRVVLAT